LPDLVNHLLPGTAGLGVDGAGLLGLGDVGGSVGELTDRLFDLRPELLQDGLDALFAGWTGR
jgi:hypothetical protein